MSILIDTSYILALLNEDDMHHNKAKAISVDIDSGKYGATFITDHILDETVSVALRKWGKEKALYFGRFILERIQLIISDEHLIKETWRIFKETRLNLSFTDCLSIAITKILDTKFIATFDKEFNNVYSIEVIDK